MIGTWVVFIGKLCGTALCVFVTVIAANTAEHPISLITILVVAALTFLVFEVCCCSVCSRFCCLPPACTSFCCFPVARSSTFSSFSHPPPPTPHLAPWTDLRARGDHRPGHGAGMLPGGLGTQLGERPLRLLRRDAQHDRRTQGAQDCQLIAVVVIVFALGVSVQ